MFWTMETEKIEDAIRMDIARIPLIGVVMVMGGLPLLLLYYKGQPTLLPAISGQFRKWHNPLDFALKMDHNKGVKKGNPYDFEFT